MPTVFTAACPSSPESGTDDRAAEWLELAKSGDTVARQALLGWAYGRARTYYMGKVHVEASLTLDDAEDLTGAFLVEFHRAWPRVSAVSNYTRRMLRNNLNRYLRHKRLVRLRETPFAREQEANYSTGWFGPFDDAGGDGWNDETWRRHVAVRRALGSVDPFTRDLILMRAGTDGLSYREIARRLGRSEAALRMRAARFYQLAREEHHRLLGSGAAVGTAAGTAAGAAVGTAAGTASDAAVGTAGGAAAGAAPLGPSP